MNWTNLFNDFLSGKSDAIQAVFSILGFITTVVGIIYVAISFKKQEKINKLQTEINEYSLEKDRRQIRPIFVLTSDHPAKYGIKLTNARATNIELFDYINGKPLTTAHEYQKRDYLEDGQTLIETEVSETNEPRKMVNPRGAEPITMIKYKDEDGRKYQQELIYHIGIHLTFPKLIK